MELEHSFTVPVPLDRAWDVLLDVERVAPCMPGASLDSVNGDEIKGRIKVKVGPISMTYAGTARFTERDAATRVMKLEAAGKETRGAGTASATVRSELHGEGDETRVIVHTSLNVTGRPAQFGRGVMSEISGKLIGIFAANLASLLTADSATAKPASASAPAEDDLALPVEELHLALRSHNSLRRDGIHTVGELVSRTGQQLLAIDHIGPASVEEIRQKLAERGLSLRDGAESTAAGRSAMSGTVTAGGPTSTSAAGSPAGTAGTSAAGASTPAAGASTPAAGTTASGSAAASRAAANGGSGQPAPAPGPRPVPADARPPDEDAIDLLSVAGLPVLKRAVPVLAAVVVAVAVVLRFRLSRRRAAR